MDKSGLTVHIFIGVLYHRLTAAYVCLFFITQNLMDSRQLRETTQYCSVTVVRRTAKRHSADFGLQSRRAGKLLYI